MPSLNNKNGLLGYEKVSVMLFVLGIILLASFLINGAANHWDTLGSSASIGLLLTCIVFTALGTGTLIMGRQYNSGTRPQKKPKKPESKTLTRALSPVHKEQGLRDAKAKISSTAQHEINALSEGTRTLNRGNQALERGIAENEAGITQVERDCQEVKRDCEQVKRDCEQVKRDCEQAKRDSQEAKRIILMSKIEDRTAYLFRAFFFEMLNCPAHQQFPNLANALKKTQESLTLLDDDGLSIYIDWLEHLEHGVTFEGNTQTHEILRQHEQEYINESSSNDVIKEYKLLKAEVAAFDPSKENYEVLGNEQTFCGRLILWAEVMVNQKEAQDTEERKARLSASTVQSAHPAAML